MKKAKMQLTDILAKEAIDLYVDISKRINKFNWVELPCSGELDNIIRTMIAGNYSLCGTIADAENFERTWAFNKRIKEEVIETTSTGLKRENGNEKNLSLDFLCFALVYDLKHTGNKKSCSFSFYALVTEFFNSNSTMRRPGCDYTQKSIEARYYRADKSKNFLKKIIYFLCVDQGATKKLDAFSPKTPFLIYLLERFNQSISCQNESPQNTP